MKKLIVSLFTIMLLLAVVSCDGAKEEKKQADKPNNAAQVTQENSASLHGDYVCTKHWNEALVGEAKITFGDDNKVNFAGQANTTYRLKGDSVFIDMHNYEMGFKIEGNTLKASGSAGEVIYTKK